MSCPHPGPRRPRPEHKLQRASNLLPTEKSWIPAFAGMTNSLQELFKHLQRRCDARHANLTPPDIAKAAFTMQSRLARACHRDMDQPDRLFLRAAAGTSDTSYRNRQLRG